MKKVIATSKQGRVNMVLDYIADKAIYILLLIVFITTMGVVFAQPENQKSRPEFSYLQLETQSSGSCFGLRSSFSAGFTMNNSALSFGPVFKNENLRFSGVNLTYSYNVLSFDESFSGNSAISFFASANYHYNQSFSKNWTEIEMQVSKFYVSDNELNFRDIQYNGFEYALGFRAERKVSKRVSLYGSVAAVYYDSQRQNYNHVKLYYNEQSLVLGINAGIKWLLR